MRTVSISDRYEATEGTVLLSGIEALVRLLLTQRRLDRLRNLSTAAFISGYEGSPLGGLDQQLTGPMRCCARQTSSSHPDSTKSWPPLRSEEHS